VLVDKSIDAVRVDVLAKGLKVTRGSFYWHFQDRDDLLKQLLKSWRDAATEQIINRFERSGADPEALVRELASLPFRGTAAFNSASIELAIRAWARRDDMARQVRTKWMPSASPMCPSASWPWVTTSRRRACVPSCFTAT
jgi:AcrR family transcriptional regulator